MRRRRARGLQPVGERRAVRRRGRRRMLSRPVMRPAVSGRGTPDASHPCMQSTTIQSAGAPPARVLVAYASAQGSTAEIARAIGDRLTRAGCVAEVRDVRMVETIHRYDAVVLGSAIHNASWLAPALAFASRHSEQLKTRPVWVFSVSSLGETSSFFGPRVSRFMKFVRKGGETKWMADLQRELHPRSHRNFAGAVARGDRGRAGDVFLRVFGGTFGDHRDWADIHAWADGNWRRGRACPASDERRRLLIARILSRLVGFAT